MRFLARTRLGLLVAALVALGGCYTNKPLSVDVRDLETREPVEGARVRVRALNMYNPTWPHGTLNPSPAKSVQATTDAGGVARFKSGAPCPASILILRADVPPQALSFDVHPAERGEPSDWLATDAAGDDGAVEIRLRP